MIIYNHKYLNSFVKLSNSFIKNKFNFKHGCTLCNMEKQKISKLNSNLALKYK